MKTVNTINRTGRATVMYYNVNTQIIIIRAWTTWMTFSFLAFNFLIRIEIRNFQLRSAADIKYKNSKHYVAAFNFSGWSVRKNKTISASLRAYNASDASCLNVTRMYTLLVAASCSQLQSVTVLFQALVEPTWDSGWILHAYTRYWSWRTMSQLPSGTVISQARSVPHYGILIIQYRGRRGLDATERSVSSFRF